MISTDDRVIEWQDQFREVAQAHAESLLKVAKKHSETYREASAYINRIEQKAFRDITEPVDRTGWQITEAVCTLALHMLHEEERNMPIDKGAKQ